MYKMIWPETRMVSAAFVLSWAADVVAEIQGSQLADDCTADEAIEILEDRGVAEFSRAAFTHD